MLFAENLIALRSEFAGGTFNLPFNKNSDPCPGGLHTQPSADLLTITPACGQERLNTENPLTPFEVRTTATLPYFLIGSSRTPPTSANALFAARLIVVLPFLRVLTPVAATAGIAARAAKAAPPQIKLLLVSASTYIFPLPYFKYLKYFKIH